MSVSAPSPSAEKAAPAPARWRSTCAATVVSAPRLPLAHCSSHIQAPHTRQVLRKTSSATMHPCSSPVSLHSLAQGCPVATCSCNTGLGVCLAFRRHVADKKLKRASVQYPFLVTGI